MLNWDKTDVETLLEKVDKNGWLFPEFELHKVGNRLQRIGKGGFSVIYEMRSKNCFKANYVIKVIGFEKHSISSKQFEKAVNIQRCLNDASPYVMRIIDAKEIKIVFDGAGELKKVENEIEIENEKDVLVLKFILMEKLEKIIVKNQKTNKTELAIKQLSEENEIINFAMQIGQVLKIAHENNILHRDIKLENIFWDKEEECYKLGDFDIARYVENGNADTVVYTAGYGAPEIKIQGYDATADIYSFGITLYLLLNDLKFPYSDGYYSKKEQYIFQRDLRAPENASEEITPIIRKMCSYHKEDRYQSVDEVLNALRMLKDKKDALQTEEYFEMFPTATYCEEKVEEPCKNAIGDVRKELMGLKEDARIEGTTYFCILTVLFFFDLVGLQKEMSFVSNWMFWVLPGLFLLEGILVRLKEMYIVVGILCIVAVICALFNVGISIPLILLVISFLSGIPAVTYAGASATILWTLVAYFDKMAWFDFVSKYHLIWIVLVGTVVALGRYIYLYLDVRDLERWLKYDYELDE